MEAKETHRWTEVCIAVMVVFALAGLRTAGATEPQAATLADVGFRMASAIADDGAGFAVAVGDFDGDGVPDLAVGAPCDSTNAPGAGAVYILYGPVTSDRSLADADATILGTRPGDFAGEFLTVLDMDGDGADELVVGVPGPFLGIGADPGPLKDSCFGFGPGAQPGVNRPGEAYVYAGGARWAEEVDALAAADTVITGLTPMDHTSYDLGAGDLNGDGSPELIVGASGPGSFGSGAAFLFSGELPATVSALDADAQFVAEAPLDAFGLRIETGDVDGDGIDDLVVSATIGFGHPARPPSVYVFLGGESLRSGVVSASTADIILEGVPGERAGIGLAVTDLDGDGVDDVIIGATNSGATYVFYGPLTDHGRIPMSDADVRVEAGTGRLAGFAVSATDGTLFVGAYGDAAGGDDAGAVHRLDGALAGVIDASTTGSMFVGEAGEMAGFALVAADLSGNGIDDLIVGAPALRADGRPGAIYVIEGIDS